jgi:hypothetical protein
MLNKIYVKIDSNESTAFFKKKSGVHSRERDKQNVETETGLC